MPSATVQGRRLTVVRTAVDYGCVRGSASIVVDPVEAKPFMQIGDALHALSPAHGQILAGTRLERDIQAALAD